MPRRKQAFPRNVMVLHRRRPRRVGHDVHSTRASWVSYVARSGALLRPLGVLLARSLILPPWTPALSHFFVFVSIFLHSARFLFFSGLFPSLFCGRDSSRACQSRYSLECSVPYSPSPILRLWFSAAAFFRRLRSLAG